MKFIFDLPEYHNIHAELSFTFWTNRPKLIINGNEVACEAGDPRMFIIPINDKENLSLEFRGFTFDYQPMMVVNGKKPVSIAAKLKWYQSILASLPAVLLLIGGIPGAIIAFIGVNYAFRILRSNEDQFVKYVYVVLLHLAVFLTYCILQPIFNEWLTRLIS